MKVYTYKFPVAWGQGQGVVVASSKEKAIEEIKETDFHYQGQEIVLTVVDTRKKSITINSWAE